MKALLIYRAARFSPNSVDKDKKILEAVGDELCNKGHNVTYVAEENISDEDDADVILSMGRLPETIEWLAWKEKEARVTLNSSKGMGNASRSTIERLMRKNDIPAAPLEGDDGYWLKRGDSAAQQKADVVYAKDGEERERVLADFKARGISDVVITAHVVGDLVKFYGVRGTGFFKCFYPTDDGENKFDDEKRNGVACHYDFDIQRLMENTERLAAITGLDVYGGDCIVRSDGSFAIIDFNDWPSFSRCREEAAKAIVLRVERIQLEKTC